MKSFKNKFIFFILYYLFWVVYFAFARLFFLIYYYEKTQEIGFINALKTFYFGSPLDISFAGYLSFIPFLLISIISYFSMKFNVIFIRFYTFFILIFINLLLFIDAGLYQAWGDRLDTSILPYLNTPTLMITSASKMQLLVGIFGWIFFSILFFKVYKMAIDKNIAITNSQSLKEIPIFLLITASLIIPVRGGFQTIPVNQSNVYFSEYMFANHAAVNFIWNFFNSVTNKTDGTNPYVYFENDVAEKIIFRSKNKLETITKDSILKTSNPNVILIIWESLSAKIVGSLGGESGVTPNLNRLSKEGILFTNFYSNGDRTDKGIPAILSGYYPQPFERIMRMPNKTRSLPMLPKKMKALGYEISYYYGGDLNFGNMNTYLRNAGINHIIDGNVFDKDDWNSKWGAHDNVFMQRFADDLAKPQKEPFFNIALTLSSHEPFEIKGAYKFGKKSEEDLYRSAHHFTDSIIGRFIDFAKTQCWYENTLIVIMADHGHSLPKHKGSYFSPKKFQIPMLWLGGALKSPIKNVDIVSSQVDFSFTLLQLLNGETTDFVFGKNMFLKSDAQYAHYIFNKGFGTLTKNGVFIFDYVSKKPIFSLGENLSKLDSLGKAITQISYQDFLERK